jgi:hypothetical protein
MIKQALRQRPDLSIWNSRRIREVKSEIKQQLSTVGSGHERVAMIFAEIARRSSSQSSLDLLKTFVLCMHGLILHSRSLILRPGECQELESTALNILSMHGIDGSKSRVGFLYSELFLVTSQIARREGDHWRSAWLQGLANETKGRSESNSELDGSLALAAGLRAERLGFGQTAHAELSRALQMDLSRPNQFRARISLVQIARLSRDYHRCRQLLAEAFSLPDLTEEERLALEWESLCSDAVERGSILKILQATAPKGSHHVAGYAVQAYLWRSLSTEDLVFRMTSFQRVSRSDNLHLTTTGFIYRVADAITRFDDKEENIMTRVDRLGKVMCRRAELSSIENELVCLAAAFVKLREFRQESFARLCLDAYQQLCRGISSGRTDNSLGLKW